jgi:hypothetical protein
MRTSRFERGTVAGCPPPGLAVDQDVNRWHHRQAVQHDWERRDQTNESNRIAWQFRRVVMIRRNLYQATGSKPRGERWGQSRASDFGIQELSMSMPENLNDVYVGELKDLWSANDQMLKVLKKITTKASDASLTKMLTRSHAGITQHTDVLKALIAG